MTTAWVPLATTTLSSSASSVTFSSISGSYRDLVLVIAAKNTGGTYDNIRVQFNSDTGSNYSYVQAYFNGSGYASNSATTTFIEGLTSSHTHNSASIMQVLDYSATNKHTTTLQRGNTATAEYGNRMAAGRWANTSAVTSITITQQSTNFDTGSTFSLWGSNRL